MRKVLFISVVLSILSVVINYRATKNKARSTIPIVVDNLAVVEGFRTKPYILRGVWHIGYGMRMGSQHEITYITESEARDILVGTVTHNYVKLRSLIEGFGTFPEGVQVATQMAYYNNTKLIGPIYRRYVEAKDWESASMELAYGHSPGNMIGLVNRRIAEANIIRKDLGYDLLTPPKTIEEFNVLKKYWYDNPPTRE